VANSVLKRLTGAFTQGSDHAPRWSVIGGGLIMLCNAATLPALYFFLDKSVFATWATALACLNLWCFPEGARTLLVTSGHAGSSAAGIGLRDRLMLVAGGVAALTMLGQFIWLYRREPAGEALSYLAPEILLSLAIPLRFFIAERRGELQAGGLWRQQALVMGSLSFGMSAGVILTAWLSHRVELIAVAYVVGVLCQSLALAGKRPQGEAVVPHVTSGSVPSFWGALALSLGPLILTPGDKVVLRLILDTQVFADYTFCTALAGQISILSALPCIPLVAWFQQPEASRARLLATARRWNLHLILLSVVGLIGGFAILQAVLPQSRFGHLSLTVAAALILNYGAFSLNAPGYFLLLGHGRFNFAGYSSMSLALLAVMTIGGLALAFGLMGAVAGNAVFALTVLMGPVAGRLSPEVARGWWPGVWWAVAMLVIMFSMLAR